MEQVSYILLGLAPSIIWLLFYLKKDIHPEPKKKVVVIFFSGGLAAVLAGVIETILIKRMGLSYAGLAEASLIFFLIAFIEEVGKYLPFPLLVLRHEELDEPIDIPEYLISSALGFAALENVFLFFSKKLRFLEVFLVSGFRFVGATLLHALCSGLLGFFIALAFIHRKTGNTLKAKLLSLAGFGSAIFLHTLYNFSIIRVEKVLKILLPLSFLGVAALLLSCGLGKLSKLKGLCKD